MEVQFSEEYQDVDPVNRVPAYDQFKKEHLWVIGAVFQVNVEQDTSILDRENLIQLTNVFCNYCDLLCTDLGLTTKCTGKPGSVYTSS